MSLEKRKRGAGNGELGMGNVERGTWNGEQCARRVGRKAGGGVCSSVRIEGEYGNLR